MKREIANWTKEIEEIRAQEEVLNARRKEIRNSAALLLAKFKEGDTVTYQQGKKTVRARIIRPYLWMRWEEFSEDNVCYKAQRILKDGSLGQEFEIRHWDNPVLEKAQ